MRAALLVAALVVAFAPAMSHADPPADLATAIRAMLGGIERPPADDRIRALGPRVVPLLARLVADGATPLYMRLRAVHAIALFTTPEARRELEHACGSAEDEIAREAVLALGAAFGERAIDTIDAMLAHTSVDVREGAVIALGRIGTNDAKTRLDRRMPAERDENIRRAIVRARAAR
jgi:HEAT repeat protein